MNIVLVLHLLFPLNASAVTIETISNQPPIKLVTDKKNISYYGKEITVIIPKKKCNEILTQEFESKIKNALKESGKPLLSKKDGNLLVDNKKTFFVMSSAIHDFINNVPMQMAALQNETNLKCKK